MRVSDNVGVICGVSCEGVRCERVREFKIRGCLKC